VLFDEIEKAHPDVFNIVLQVMEDGRLTDSHGRTVNFKNSLVIMTSNVGGEFLRERHAGDDEEVREQLLAALHQQFRPEFLNRVDAVIVFNSLSLEDVKRIVAIQVGHLERRLADRRITLRLSEAAAEELARDGFDPLFGARPVRRVIQQRVMEPLALRLLKGEFSDGDTVAVDTNHDGLCFERLAAQREEVAVSRGRSRTR
ncbi:MAG: AAA family ATPase, partial [Chloroflexi bacterium]|nr:AAA family ATPase [Chloroflexota bacterium]